MSILCFRIAAWHGMILCHSSCSLDVVLIDLRLLNVCSSGSVNSGLILPTILLACSQKGHLAITLPSHCFPVGKSGYKFSFKVKNPNPPHGCK